MTFLRDRTERRLVPRWKASKVAAGTPDFLSTKSAPAVRAGSDDQAGSASLIFNESCSLGTAAEAIAEALLEGNQAGARAGADFVLMNELVAPRALLGLAQTIVRGDPYPNSAAIGEVATMRALLKLAPNNPALWSDMARHHAARGDKHRALRCMRTALQLAPDHRWMLRTASRFFVHQEEPGIAHRLLANHPRTRNDPWLIAAELACAQVAGHAPRYWRLANEIIKFDRFPPLHISELATAVGMMELETGKRKQARKLVQIGLIAPTENTLAQVFWARDRKNLGDSLQLDSLIVSADDAYEAEFKLRLQEGDLHGALNAANTWTGDEPFAARPKFEIAYVASLLDDHDLTLRMANEVLRVDGRLSVGLELNKIFALLSSRRLAPEKDSLEIRRIEIRLRHLVEHARSGALHATANLALWNYRYGSLERGRALYRAAIDVARKSHGVETAAHAAMFAAREALIAGDSEAANALAIAKELAERSGSEACLFYVRKLDAVARTPDRKAQLLSPSAAEKFLKPTNRRLPKGVGRNVLTMG